MFVSDGRYIDNTPAQEGGRHMERIRIDRRGSRLRALKRRNRDLAALEPLRYDTGGGEVDDELLDRIDEVLADVEPASNSQRREAPRSRS